MIFGCLLALCPFVWAQEGEFTSDFRIEDCEFTTIGRNPFFILEPGYTLTLTGEDEDEVIVLKITVLNETEFVNGVLTRVVEERQTVGGVIEEISRNFFAICKKTNNVFYFGEDVDNFDEDGNFVDHASAWRAGVGDAVAGVFMPGEVLLGSKYFQEIAPEEAMDRAENVSITETVETPFGTFHNCLKTLETTPLEPDAEEFKSYAPGIGIIQDGDLLLSDVSTFEPIELPPLVQESEFTENFMLDLCEFSTIGRNPHFILQPGYQRILQGEEDDEVINVTITVLDETEVVNGVETRVVEERETADGVLTEISRNFFAICQRTNSVFYFGEDVDNYEDDGVTVADHDGSWRAGEDGARAGLIMSGTPLLGSRYYQEIFPEEAMDRGEDVSISEAISTPAGDFENCLLIRETTPLEPDELSIKVYAPGIGMVQDDSLFLVGFQEPSSIECWELMR